MLDLQRGKQACNAVQPEKGGFIGLAEKKGGAFGRTRWGGGVGHQCSRQIDGITRKASALQF